MPERRAFDPLRLLRQLRAILRRVNGIDARFDELGVRVDDLERSMSEQTERLEHSMRAIVGSVPATQTRRVVQPYSLAGVDELRDTVSLLGRSRRRNPPHSVLMLVHLPATWDALAPVHQALLDADDFEVTVVSIPSTLAGDDDATEERTDRFLTDRGIEHVRMPAVDAAALRLVKQLDPALILRQAQWDADVPQLFSAARLAFAPLAVVPYETMNIVENPVTPETRDTAVDSDLHRVARVVVATNEEMRIRAHEHSARGATNVLVTGHPKAQVLLEAQPLWPLDGPAERRIVWSAHHSVGTGWSDFGSFPAVREAMIDWAEERPADQIAFLPHPALVPYLRTPESPLDEVVFLEWLARWKALPNTAIVETGYPPVLAASDALVTDGLSMLVEYQLLAKPLVFLERPGHRPFNAIGERLSEGFHTVATVEEARRVLDEIHEEDPRTGAQRRNARELFGPDPRGAAVRIVRAMRESLQDP